MAHKFRIIVNTDLDPAINVHLNNATIIIFKQCSRRLYSFDTTKMGHNIINSQVTCYTLLNTVEIKNSHFHQRATNGVDREIILQQILGWPATQTIKEAVGTNII